MKHLKHTLGAVLLQVLVVVPTLLASPAVKHFVETHPALAVYVAVANAIVLAVAPAMARDRAASATG